MSDFPKSIYEYKAIVWDLDGTLYYQNRMRLIMLKELVKFYALHPFRFKELLAVKKFREIRERWEERSDDLESAQYAYVAGALRMSEEAVRSAVETWIYERPLAFIARCRDEKAAELFGKLREKQIGCYIFSDYPVIDKLKALGLQANGCYAATDERLGVLKPDPRGLFLIMEDTGFTPEDILMIGDRDSRDGEAARRAGCDHIILSKSKREREKQYRALCKV